MDKKFALIVSFCFILVVGNLFYLPQIVSEFRNSQDQYTELSEDYQQLQESYNQELADSGPSYTGNPFSTQLWPGQLQSENITGMHWYSLYNGALVNCTDNVLGLGAGEGEYTTWTHVWSKDYSAEVSLEGIMVNDDGTVFAMDASKENSYVRTYGGVETNRLDYSFFFHLYALPAMSVTGIYVVGGNRTGEWYYFDVWRDGAIIFTHDTSLDHENACAVMKAAISPNGKFVAIVNMSIESYFDEILMLYEGS